MNSFSILRIILNERIESHASIANQEIRDMSKRAREEIAVQYGWMRRSQSQIRRWSNVKKRN